MGEGAVLVTGGAGYIGSHTVKQLSRDGYFPVTYDNLSEGHRWAVIGGDFIQGDLSDTEKLVQVFNEYEIEAVMHFAASAYVGESVGDPKKYFDNNVSNTINLLNTSLNKGIDRFVFSSSCAVYGEPQEIPLTEKHPKEPINPYGETKLMVEKILDWYSKAYDFEYISLRYFNAAGADPDGEIGEAHDPETHLIPLVLQTALGERQQIDIYGTDYDTHDGTCIRDYIHVMDLARAHIAGLKHLSEGGKSECLNLGNGEGHSVKEVIETARGITGRDISTNKGKRRPGDPPVLIASPRKAKEVLGWEPVYDSLGEMVATAWKWIEK